MGLSLAEKIAKLDPAERAKVLNGIEAEDLMYDPRFWLREEQLQCLDATEWLTGYIAGRGSGKAVVDDELIPTPTGFTAMGDLEVGDFVFDHAGRPTEVIGVFPQGEVPCARVTFSDKSSVVVSLDHLWTVFKGKNRGWYVADVDVREYDPDWWRWTRVFEPTHVLSSYTRTRAGRTHVVPAARRRSNQPRVNTGPVTVTTEQIMGAHIPVAGALELPDADLPADPYVFGAWLGDGSTGAGYMCAHPDDADHFMAEFVARGYDVTAARVDSRTGVVTWKSQRLHDELRALGLSAGRVRPKKDVPPVFLRGSIRQRLDFIRGLMDTDGSIGRGCDATAGFMNEQIANALEEALRSVGYITRRRVRMYPATKTRQERPFFIVMVRPVPDTNPFLLDRKAREVTDLPRNQATRKTMRRVVAVEPVGDRPATCIKVAAASELFLVGEAMVPTHNTRTGAEWIRDKAKVPNTRIALVARTAADVRDVMVQGQSGILSVCPPSEQPDYIPSARRLVWPNGSVAITYSAEEPNQLRGPQFNVAWCVAAHVPVRTRRGDVPMASVVDGDYVLTRAGWRRVLAATHTGYKFCYRVRAGESELVATADHRVYANGAWKDVQDLAHGDTMLECRDHTLSTSTSRLDRLPGAHGRACAGTSVSSTDGTGATLVSYCPSPCGSTRTDLSQTGTKSTMSTARSGMTGSTTSSSSGLQITGSVTRQLTRLVSALRIVLLGRKHSGRIANRSLSRVPTAGRRSTQLACEPSSAHSCAAPASVEVSSVEPWGWSDVYDLTVEGVHEFFAGGLLVHNCDELAAWKFKPDDSGLTAWDNLQIATRLGANPQILVTTTPKRVKAVRTILDLAKSDPARVRIVRGSTMDNASNLSKAYLETITAMYAGTSIELQELYGELLDAVEGALWSESQIPHISSAFTPDDLNGYLRIVGVDPSVAANPGDECGIVVVACTQEYQHYKRTGVVLDDKSLKADPDTWVQQVVASAKEWEAIVVAEQNQGFDLVRMAIKQADPTVPLVMVHASKGKAARAEPIVMAYQQGRVSHVGEFAELEDEMTSWVPGESGYSPNRLDALVWALSAGLVDDNAEVRKRVGALRGIMPSRDRDSSMTRRVPALAGRSGQYDTGPIRSGRLGALTAPWRR